MTRSFRNLAALAYFLGSTACALAQAPTPTLKIGVLTDTTSVYSDFGGQGSIDAAQIAIDDLGGTVAGMKIEL
jgi:branched-chain amino acid transport system substrate-binding protein